MAAPISAPASASARSLPLLHKYVLSPQDDMELTLTKLKFRLCVKEVSNVLQTKSRVMDLTEDQAFEDETPSPWKNDDSGLEHDFGVIDDSRCGQNNFNEISEEFDVSRQTDSCIDETCGQESFATVSSSSSSSSSSTSSSPESEEEQEPMNNEQEQDEEPRNEEQGHDISTQDNDETVNPKSQRNEIFENFHVETSTADENPTFGEKQEEEEEEEMEEMDEQESLSLLNPTVVTSSEGTPQEEAKLSGIQCETKNEAALRSKTLSIGAEKGDSKSDCNDVLEALRILKTRSELPKITHRRSNTIVTFSSWNVTDLVRSPQKATTIERPSETIKRKSELQATNDKILSKERKFAEIYKKIRERDEEDQRLMEDALLKKHKIPVAKPLPLPSTTTTTTVTRAPQTPGPIPKSALDTAEKADNNPKTRSKEDRIQKSNSQTGTGKVPEKNKKKQGGILHSVVQSLQRRFSRRGRQTTT